MSEIRAKIKGNYVKHRKQSKMFACGALRGQKSNLNNNIFTYLCENVSFKSPEGRTNLGGVLTARRAEIFLRCFLPPEGRIFFNVFEKPKKNTVSRGCWIVDFWFHGIWWISSDFWWFWAYLSIFRRDIRNIRTLRIYPHPSTRMRTCPHPCG